MEREAGSKKRVERRAGEEKEDFSEPLCAACKSGGDLFCCAGKCLRSFHPKCLGMSTVDVDRFMRKRSPFVCSDCGMGVQRCFSCLEFGLEEDLVKCSMKFCGKFFHSKCLVKKKELSHDRIICPLHICHSCGEAQTGMEPSSAMWRCFRCPKAYDIGHRPRDVHVLSTGIFLCIKHTLEKEIWPDLPKELVRRVRRKSQQTSQPKTVTKKLREPSTAVTDMKNALKSVDMDNIIPDNCSGSRRMMGVTRAAKREYNSHVLKPFKDIDTIISSVQQSTSSIVNPKAAQGNTSQINLNKRNHQDISDHNHHPQKRKSILKTDSSPIGSCHHHVQSKQASSRNTFKK